MHLQSPPEIIHLGFQPGSGDWAPGTVTLRIQNQTGSTVTSALVSYLAYIYNDQGRSNSFNCSYSSDNSIYTDILNIDLTSTAALEATPNWKACPRSSVLTGLSIANEGFLYLRWSGADVGGSGSRDEFALDNITLITNPTTTKSTLSGTIQDAIIDGSTNMNGNTTVNNNLTITTSGNLTIPSAGQMTVIGTLANSAGDAGLIVESGGSLIAQQ